MTLLDPKIEKSKNRLLIEKVSPSPPTWHQILKTIRMLGTIFYYMYK